MFKLNSKGGWIVPANTAIPNGTSIPAHSELGDGCKLGDGCRINNKLVMQFMTLGNVDGSGRQLLLYSNAEGVYAICGCFRGTAQELIAKAQAEGKTRYVAVVTALLGVLACAS